MVATATVVSLSIAFTHAPERNVSARERGIAVVPYTVTLTEVVVGRAGRSFDPPDQTWAFRSDGASLLKLGDGPGGSRQLVFPDGVRVEVNDFQLGKSTTLVPTLSPEQRQPDAMCLRLSGLSGRAWQLRKAVIEHVRGFRTARVSDGSVTQWFALDYGCALVRRTANFGAQKSQLELVSLIPGEPSEALFEVPDHYREGPPSMFAPASSSESLRRHFEVLDRNYEQYRLR